MIMGDRTKQADVYCRQGDNDDVGHHVNIINTLPEEILERILSYLSPYSHCKQASLVCKKWNRVIQGVLQQTRQNFQIAAAEGRLQWSNHECPVTLLTARHSHSMCRVREDVYVFGGCSSSLTAFNDMWKLNLLTRMWTRVLALGSYPSPKAAASMVTYKDNLILFGGWAPPVPYPLHQAPHIFNELQVFSIKENKWNLVVTQSYPPPVAGHQATIIGDKMIVFGGMINLHHKLNDIYVLDLTMMSWYLVKVTEPIPPRRYGHLQYALGDKHLLIVGGCGVSNKTLSDVWLLQFGDGEYQGKWTEIEVRNQENAPPVIFGHAACLIGTTITIFGKSKNPSNSLTMRRSQVLASAPQPVQQPAPSSLNSVQRSPINVRQELRSHGVLLKETNKQANAEVSGNGASQNDIPCVEGMDSQPSTSDSQVCDELHTNSFGSTNMVNMEGIDNGNSVGASGSRAGNGGFNKTAGQRSAMVQQNAASSSKLNSRETNSLRNLNQAHMGQLGPRKSKKTMNTASNTKHARDIKCLCSSKSIQRSTMCKHLMQQYVLDISNAITCGYVTWQAIPDHNSDNKDSNRPIFGVSPQHGPPTGRCFSSVCEGRGELIMFGGLLDDSNQFGTGKTAVNTVHYAL